jgi:hypothetical protein
MGSVTAFFYNVSPIGGATYVNDISRGTSSEPIGERPADVSPKRWRTHGCQKEQNNPADSG